MEKSFNEDELADIMNEIESLESDSDHVESHELAEASENVHSITSSSKESHKTADKPHTQMSFNVEGQMNLSLGFVISGAEVSINVSEEGMEITMENGATFHLPIDSKQVA